MHELTEDRQTLIDMAKHSGPTWSRSTRKPERFEEEQQKTLVEDSLQEYAKKMQSMNIWKVARV